MKKAGIVLALLGGAMWLSSCEGNKEACYAITATVTFMGHTSSATSYVRTTKDDLDEAIQQTKLSLAVGGVTEDMIKISSKQVADTNCD